MRFIRDRVRAVAVARRTTSSRGGAWCLPRRRGRASSAPLAEQDLLSSFDFFLGGARTIRGCRGRRCWRDAILRVPVSGRGLLVFNQEVRFPIYGWVRGVGFIDSGTLSPEAKTRLPRHDHVRGFGLRSDDAVRRGAGDYGRVLSSGAGHSRHGTVDVRDRAGVLMIRSTRTSQSAAAPTPTGWELDTGRWRRDPSSCLTGRESSS